MQQKKKKKTVILTLTDLLPIFSRFIRNSTYFTFKRENSILFQIVISLVDPTVST